ncbi:hypothetical protein [uncultured Campylobacter sp.]|uniref:hypothetical protein n=1 Tax=uncultured Campylobacter sp. TaxID=218934 RepID=UPI0026180DFD|nr:hypothetical protein [uncultured Campylobacter sp.]
MKKAITLKKFAHLLNEEQIRCQKIASDFFDKRYKDLAFFLHKKADINLEQAFKMLFYPNYTLNIELSFKVYKDGRDNFHTKKPNLFLRFFKTYTTHQIKIFKDNVKLDGEEILNKDLNGILIVFK